MDEFDENELRQESEGPPKTPKDLGIQESMLGGTQSEDIRGKIDAPKEGITMHEKPTSHEEGEKQTKIWGGVTDPIHHDPDHYRYLIHAFNPVAKTTMPIMQNTAHRDGILNIRDKSNGDQSIDLFKYPEKLNERVSLSMSLIDQDHHGTWGSIGLIVEAPEENIVLTSSSDTGSLNASPDFLRQQAAKHYHMTGDQLLAQSYEGSHNEVVALAKTGQGGPLKLKGFFAKVDDEGYLEEKSAQRLKIHAERLGLPLIEIAEPPKYLGETYKETDGVRQVTHSGKLYNLGGNRPNRKYGWEDNTKRAFNYYTSRSDSFFTSPQELEEALKVVAEYNPGKPELIEQIRREYNEANAKRSAPELHYDKDGGLEYITILHGYGKDTWEYSITRNGHARHVNVYEESLAVRESMMNQRQPQRISLRENWWEQQIDTETADKAIEEGLAHADPETAKKVKAFYDEVRLKIQEMYSPPIDSIFMPKPSNTDLSQSLNKGTTDIKTLEERLSSKFKLTLPKLHPKDKPKE